MKTQFKFSLEMGHKSIVEWAMFVFPVVVAVVVILTIVLVNAL